LLTDIMMPGMSGVELAHEARRLRPALRVLLSSGYVLEGFDNAEQWPSGTKMLRKPYGKAELHRALDDA
jgi:two-component system cell cycle sensor histidine kinase/response regulator CckA